MFPSFQEAPSPANSDLLQDPETYDHPLPPNASFHDNVVDIGGNLLGHMSVS